MLLLRLFINKCLSFLMLVSLGRLDIKVLVSSSLCFRKLKHHIYH